MLWWAAPFDFQLHLYYKYYRDIVAFDIIQFNEKIKKKKAATLPGGLNF